MKRAALVVLLLFGSNLALAQGALTVTAVMPFPGETDIGLKPTVGIDFSQELDAATVSDSTVFLTDSTPVHLQYDGNRRNDGSWMKEGETVPPTTKSKHSKFVHVYGAVCGFKLLGPYYIAEGNRITGVR